MRLLMLNVKLMSNYMKSGENSTLKLTNKNGACTGSAFGGTTSGKNRYLLPVLRSSSRRVCFAPTTLDNGTPVQSLAFSPDGEMVVTGSGEGAIRVWKKDGKGWNKVRLLRTFQGHSANIWDIDFSPDGEIFASASLDNTVKLWRKDAPTLPQDPQPLRTLKGQTSGIYTVDFSPDGKVIASASADGTVKLWKFDRALSGGGTSDRHKALLLRTLKGHAQGVMAVSFSPDGAIVATASLDNTIKLWNSDGILLRTLTAHTGLVRKAAFSPDGTQLASASADQTAILWNVKRILNTDPLAFGCDWVRDYLRTNADVKEEDRHLCDHISN